MQPKTKSQKEYEAALRRLFRGIDSVLIMKQWKKYILNVPSVNPQATMEVACWKGGGKDVYRDLLKIISQGEIK